MLRQLRRAGLRTSSFGYSVSRESFAQVASRLVARLRSLLDGEELVLIGHSLGGVLLREALCTLGTTGRRAGRLFLLGSPIQTARLAIRLGGNPFFRLATRDCGQLLASPERMAAVGIPDVPTTAIVGTRGILNLRGPFGTETNDGIVSLSEVSAGWLEDRVLVPVVHTLLPSSRRVGAVILERLRRGNVETQVQPPLRTRREAAPLQSPGFR
jgi:pimeloyl-ACP methyl ester carboxylesterase